jgi:hypothetical protein
MDLQMFEIDQKRKVGRRKMVEEGRTAESDPQYQPD